MELGHNCTVRFFSRKPSSWPPISSPIICRQRNPCMSRQPTANKVNERRITKSTELPVTPRSAQESPWCQGPRRVRASVLPCFVLRGISKAMTTNQRLQLAGGIIETILGFPVLGGMFILSHGWLPLLGALIFHIVTLVYVVNERGNKVGPLMGIAANTLGIIPFVGWILHIVAATFLLTTALSKQPPAPTASDLPPPTGSPAQSSAQSTTTSLQQ
jgi:hypothetical protein